MLPTCSVRERGRTIPRLRRTRPRAYPAARMRPLLLALALPLVAGAAPHARRELVVSLSELQSASPPVRTVAVESGVTTILTIPTYWRANPRGTGVPMKWRRTVQVVFGADRVFVTPRRPLGSGERVPFLLRFTEGTVVPMLLVAPSAPQGADGEVAVTFDTDEAEGLRVQLAAAREQQAGLAEQLRQALMERDSEDFALAQLFAGNRAEATSFRKVGERVLEEGDRRAQLITYASAPLRHGPRKVAVVVTMTNKGTEPVMLQASDLFRRSTLEMVPFAARAQPAEIGPGATGRLSVVLDATSMEADETLTLEVRQRSGERVTSREVDLGAADFGGSTWWPF